MHRRRRWSGIEIQILAHVYQEEGPGPLIRMLARSEKAITSQARNQLGLRSESRRQRQAQTWANRNRSVNIEFFEAMAPSVAYVLGVVWAIGHIATPIRVLKLTCPTHQEAVLLAVRRALGSRHRVHRGKGRTRVQISSSRLVRSIVERYGRPPCRSNPDPPLPPIPEPYLAHFAKGMLDGGGLIDEMHITWASTPQLIAELHDKLQHATGVPTGTITTRGPRSTLTWDQPDQVQGIQAWLQNERGSSSCRPEGDASSQDATLPPEK